MTKVEAERRDEEQEEVKEEGNDKSFFAAWRNIIWSKGKVKLDGLLPILFLSMVRDLD